MQIVEKYSHALSSPNLKDDELHTVTNVIIAVALSPIKIATLMFRVKYHLDATSYRTLLENWQHVVTKKSTIRNWPKTIPINLVAKQSLDYYLGLNYLCQDCSGRGFKTHLDKTGMLQHSCEACNSTGIKPVKTDQRIIKYVQDMVDTLEDMETVACNVAKKKCANYVKL